MKVAHVSVVIVTAVFSCLVPLVVPIYAYLIPDPIFETFDHVSKGAMNELMPADRQNQFLKFDKIRILNHPQPNWDCTLFFGMDSSRGQFLILHQEGFSANPHIWYHFGREGNGDGEYERPNDFCVAGLFYGDDLDYAAIYSLYVADTGNARIQKLSLASHYLGGKGNGVVRESTDLFPSENMVPAAVSIFGKEYGSESEIDLVVNDISTNNIVILSETSGRKRSLTPADLGQSGYFMFQRVQGWSLGEGDKYLAVSGHSHYENKLIIMKFPGGDYSVPVILKTETVPHVRDMAYGPGTGLFVLHKGEFTAYTNYNELITGTLWGENIAVDAIREHLYLSTPFRTDEMGGVYRYRASIGTRIDLLKSRYFSDVEPITFEYAINQSGQYRLKIVVERWGQHVFYPPDLDYSVGVHQAQWASSDHWGMVNATVTARLERLQNNRVFATYSSDVMDIRTGPIISIGAPTRHSVLTRLFDVTINTDYPQNINGLRVDLLNEIHGDVFQSETLNDVASGQHTFGFMFPAAEPDFPCSTRRDFVLTATAWNNRGDNNQVFGWDIYTYSKPCDYFPPVQPHDGDDGIIIKGTVKYFREFVPYRALAVYDLRGRKVAQMRPEGAGWVLGDHNVSAGVYFVRGAGQGKQVIKKVLVMK